MKLSYLRTLLGWKGAYVWRNLTKLQVAHIKCRILDISLNISPSIAPKDTKLPPFDSSQCDSSNEQGGLK